jgi:hypothetical protein
MAEFKPMVKMFTDEPSVMLKLKKGGKVKSKAAGQAEGFKSMSQTSGGNPFAEAEKGKAPKKPSISARMKAMNPNMYAKGGKVAHKQMGGAMPMAAGAGALGGMAPVGTGAAMAPMNRAALAGMPPAARLKRAMAVRKALAGMKKGGSTSADCAKLERELKHHEAMSAARAHGKASGGEIDAAETKTTLKNSVKPFAKSKMVTAKKDTAHGTGEVKEGKPGGYAMGGTIEGNEGAFENTKMVTAGKGKTNGTTGGVRMSNAGGFKKGGKAMKKASGGTIDAKLTRTTVEGGNWENRPANTSKPGKTNTKTGEVKEANGGGYKRGGSASKKAFATGGQVVDDGKAVKMPRHFVSAPVANSLQSGTFKKGGKVEKEEKPNLRLVKTHRGPDGHTAKVYKDRDWDEYRVRFYSPNGQHHPNADYHTETAEDAHDTAMGQVRRGYKRGGKAKMATGGIAGVERLEDPRYSEMKKDKEINESRMRQYISAYPDSSTAKRYREQLANPNYSETAVNKSIASSNRSGRKISGKEAQRIHALLKGRYADGGKVPSDVADQLKTAENERAYKNWERIQREENEADRNMIPNALRRAADTVKGFFSSSKPPEGGVTKTEKSVTVTPAKKRGGLAKC